MSSSIQCPVCYGDSKLILSLPKKEIINKLSDYYNEEPPKSLKVADYRIFKCNNCTLEYSMPLEAGNSEFYKWVTTKPNYYPQLRWEWLSVIEQIQNSNKNDIDVLEVGCGRGDFLDLCQRATNVQMIGLDTTLESVNYCQKRGLNVYSDDIQVFSQKLSGMKFDYVVSFHCLEHISEPKEFVESLLSAIKPDGSILISTPNSPMSFEASWFDIMNYPPHHITRWNKKAYDELARQFQCSVKYLVPQPGSLLGRTVTTFRLLVFGKNRVVSNRQLYLSIIRKPFFFLQLLAAQFQHSKHRGKFISDVILVELKPLKD